MRVFINDCMACDYCQAIQDNQNIILPSSRYRYHHNHACHIPMIKSYFADKLSVGVASLRRSHHPIGPLILHIGIAAVEISPLFLSLEHHL